MGSPFSRQANGACVPTFPARMSQKVSAFVTGNFATGTQGFGFVAVSPTVSNNAPLAYSSISAYNSTAVDCLNVNAQTTVMSALPYNSSQLLTGDVANPAPVSGRIVSCGLRVRYIGTELNRGGVCYCLVTPDHTNVQGFSMALLSTYSECIKVPVSRQWTTIVASAIDMKECEYPEEATQPSAESSTRQMLFPYSQQNAILATSLTVGAPIMLFGVASPAGNAFEFEVIQHVEYIGTLTQALATKSHSDQAGLSKVTEAAGTVLANRASSGAPQESSFLASLKQTIIDNRDIVVPLTRMAAQMYMGNQRARGNLRAIQNGYGL